MNLYVVRHGQTDWNVERRLQGRTDVELNSIGIQQANTLANELKSINFSAIYSSPLKRTIDTAKLINEYHHLDIITDNRLIERCFGNFEGTKNVLNDIADYLDYEKNLDTHNVESIRTLFKRIDDFLNDIYDNFRNTNANILLVTHGGVCIAITAILNNTKSDLLSLGMKNCEIKIFENLEIEGELI